MSSPGLLDLASVSRERLAAEVAAARLICLPTDTVYGLGGVVSPAVAAAIAAAKGREGEEKPLQVIYPSLELLERSVAMEPRLRDAVRRLLPGPFTLVIPYPSGLRYPPPGALPAGSASVAGEASPSGSLATLGVRVPQWPEGAQRLAELPFALLASSANFSGEPAPRSLEEVDPRLLALCDVVLSAGPVAGLASTVLDLTAYASERRWRILRRGAVDETGVSERLIHYPS